MWLCVKKIKLNEISIYIKKLNINFFIYFIIKLIFKESSKIIFNDDQILIFLIYKTYLFYLFTHY